MIDTVWGSTQKPASARQLAEILSQMPNLTGTLYIGYPVIGTPEGAFPFDALLLSPEKGAVAFDLVEGRQLGSFQARQDDLYAKLHSKLLQYPSLVERRSLAAPIHTVTFAPALSGATGTDDAPVADATSLSDTVNEIVWHRNEIFPALASAIQALTSIRKGRRKRSISNSNSRGARLHALNESIATLDANQNAAVVETVSGVQRIRGLAGSGKTIVLALKVAYLHAQNPDWMIAVTFNTRSLKGQFERLITSFVYEQTSEEPDWSRIRVLHSWGSPSSEGVYYNFTKDHELTYRDFRSAQGVFGEGKEFSGATEEALNQAVKIKGTYDAIISPAVLFTTETAS
jgi:superfamily I DNA and RNA helicase